MRVEAQGVEGEVPWRYDPIQPAQANEFAQKITSFSRDQVTITKNLATFPPAISVRGVFFEGLGRIVAQAKGASVLGHIQRLAALPEHIVAFRQYPHRDFYKFYYLAARQLFPEASLPMALRLTAQSFFPIFRNSLFGKTMSALMGNEPETILPLLSKAYNVSVQGNEHNSERVGEREIEWTCRVEPVEWYEETFTGIIEGTMPSEESDRPPLSRPEPISSRMERVDSAATARVRVEMLSRALGAQFGNYKFRITW